jgi:hypothetical protein
MLIWTRFNALAPDTPGDNVRSPSSAEWLRGVALRDLALAETYGACADAQGDVYQWGSAFPSPTAGPWKPMLVLKGKVCDCLPVLSPAPLTSIYRTSLPLLLRPPRLSLSLRPVLSTSSLLRPRRPPQHRLHPALGHPIFSGLPDRLPPPLPLSPL